VLANKSRTKRPRKTKIVRKIVHPTSNNEPQTQGQRSKVKVTSATNAETGSESYLPNGKATNFKLGSQTQHEDPHQRQAPWPSRSKVKVARSRDASDRCWPISRERNVLGRPKLVGRLSTPRVIMRPRLKVKGQGHQVLANKSRTKLPGKTKIGRTVAHSTGNNVQQFQGQRRSTKTRIADKRRHQASYC